MNAPQPFQRLDDRLAGKPLDDVLLAGVPTRLEIPLREWVSRALQGPPDVTRRLARAVVISLGWSLNANRTYSGLLYNAPREELLVVIDAILQLTAEHPDVVEWDDITELEQLLRYGRSAYKVAENMRGLTYRVDPTVEGSFKEAVQAAEPTAAKMLQQAWYHTYRPDPDPTTAYREAIRAVEQVACPLVLPNTDKATLGTVIAHLRQATAKWETVLIGANAAPGGPEPVVELMARLWSGQVSRHGGSKNSRDQDQAEAEAAVHAAVLLVQWLSTETLRRK
ncbi:hypothetical protein ACFORH_43400 [Amycolatopsis roodepoortensis]|uniref:Uncharacterized protein n=1 Tax=Amycolatopsis roodepoortensis TaxID=700274 RepID=A0ABR9LI95_9PSEU|nr:hypothetical protein [Amycolatopsis roodepoortensis]MBE1580411.1 hypothetical protein [Amycolatopsis roodepoortensis]